jgi:flagellar hook-associated protein 2
MAGIQLTGLYSGLNWSAIIQDLVAADSIPITQLQATETTNKAQITALTGLATDLGSLQTATQGLGDFGSNVFAARSATATPATTNQPAWSVSADSTTPVGTYSVDVSTLATASTLAGASGISAPLSASADVSGTTLASLDLATPVTAGTFTVNGQSVTVALTDSLQDVFNAISTATGGTVTAAYNPSTDRISLTSTSGQVVLGAANDTSDFLQAFKLGNNGSSSVSSSGSLGSVSLSTPVASAGLATSLTGLGSAGTGSFTVNGVAISYTASTDSLTTILDQINNSSAGVTANYDPIEDRVVLTNNVTGDLGVAVADVSGNLASALGLTTGATLDRGDNATFTVNHGPARTSSTNSLGAAALGVAGLSLTATSTGTQSIAVAPDTAGMTTAINAFITAYNQLQTDITNDTQITSTNGTPQTSILTGNPEVAQWGSDLRDLVFNSISGLSGDIASLDQIGIGFAGTANQLSITDPAALQSALANDPQGVADFFQSGTAGFTNRVSTFLNATLSDNTDIQNNLTSADTQIASQVTAMQEKIALEQQTLTQEFSAMETAIQQSQDEQAQLSGSSGSGSSSQGSTTSASAYTNATGSSLSASSGSSSAASTASNSTTTSSGGS